MQKLVQVPLAVRAETEGRMLGNQIHCLIENAALDGRDLRLVIGIAHIKMHVRHKKERPFLLRLERLLHMRRVPIHNHSKLGLRIACELGNLEGNTLFPEVLIGVERLAESVARNGKLNAPGTRTLTISHEDVHSFVNGCSVFLKKDCRLCMCADDGWNRTRLLQFNGVIFEPGIRDGLITCGDSLKGAAICARLEPRSWKANFDLRTRICRVESSYRVAHVVVEPGMQIERAQAAVDSYAQSGNTGMLDQQ